MNSQTFVYPEQYSAQNLCYLCNIKPLSSCVLRHYFMQRMCQTGLCHLVVTMELLNWYPIISIKSLQLTSRLGTSGLNPLAPYLAVSCNDLIEMRGCQSNSPWLLGWHSSFHISAAEWLRIHYILMFTMDTWCLFLPQINRTPWRHKTGMTSDYWWIWRQQTWIQKGFLKAWAMLVC